MAYVSLLPSGEVAVTVCFTAYCAYASSVLSATTEVMGFSPPISLSSIAIYSSSSAAIAASSPAAKAAAEVCSPISSPAETAARAKIFSCLSLPPVEPGPLGSSQATSRAVSEIARTSTTTAAKITFFFIFSSSFWGFSSIIQSAGAFLPTFDKKIFIPFSKSAPKILGAAFSFDFPSAFTRANNGDIPPLSAPTCPRSRPRDRRSALLSCRRILPVRGQRRACRASSDRAKLHPPGSPL